MTKIATHETTKELVCFILDNEEYGIEILKVREIIRPEKTTHVPDAREFIEGIINLRGRIIPIIDLKKRFHLGTIERSEQTRIIIVDIQGKSIGLEVDTVKEVLRIQSSDINETPDVITTTLEQKYVSGIAKKDDRLIIILDVDAIFSTEEQQSLKDVSST